MREGISAKFAGKWSSMGKRERWLGAIVVALLLYALLDMLFARSNIMHTPGGNALELKRQELGLVAKQRSELTAEVDALAIVPPEAGDVSLAIGRALSAGLIWDAITAEAWLNDSVEDYGSGLEHISLQGEGSPDAQLHGFYKHEVSIDGRLPWKEFSRFFGLVSKVGALTVDSAKVEACEDSSCVKFHLKFDAESNEQFWSIKETAISAVLGKEHR